MNLLGQEFNELKVIEKTDKRSKYGGSIIWKCLCKCGKECEASTSDLRSGHKKSCGHLAVRNKTDITGQIFGYAKAIRPTDEKCNHDGSVVWELECECGNHYKVSITDLKNGIGNHCGCKGLHRSYGELEIKKLLEDNNIKFQEEYSFNNCRFIESNRPARFDFYVNNSYIIEFDGKQHFKASGHGWSTEEKTKQTQEHDRIKNDYCKQNNIAIIRIPYTKLHNIQIEDLLLDTSNYII